MIFFRTYQFIVIPDLPVPLKAGMTTTIFLTLLTKMKKPEVTRCDTRAFGCSLLGAEFRLGHLGPAEGGHSDLAGAVGVPGADLPHVEEDVPHPVHELAPVQAPGGLGCLLVLGRGGHVDCGARGGVHGHDVPPAGDQQEVSPRRDAELVTRDWEVGDFC